jgi:hypothetical protein
MIGPYLTELERELRLPARLRRRVLAEAADHLHESAAAYVDEGMPADEAEFAAVAAFGSARDLAHRFADELATRAVGRAAWAACAATVAFGLFFVTQVATGAIAFFAVQVAFVAGLVTLIRLLRHHGEHVVPVAKLGLLQRGSLLALACAAVTRPSLPILAGVVLAAVAVVRAQPRAVAARPFAADEPPDDIVDDVRALAARYGVRLPAVRLDWRVAGLVAVVCGLLAAAAHAQEFVGGAITWRALLASAIIIWAEALMVLVGWALFGRWLGLSAAPSAGRRPA